MALKTCLTCNTDEARDGTVRAWYCTPPGSTQTEVKALCLTDAIALEKSGWTLVIVPTTGQRAAARAWDRAGIGKN